MYIDATGKALRPNNACPAEKQVLWGWGGALQKNDDRCFDGIQSVLRSL